MNLFWENTSDCSIELSSGCYKSLFMLAQICNNARRERSCPSPIYVCAINRGLDSSVWESLKKAAPAHITLLVLGKGSRNAAAPRDIGLVDLGIF